MTSLSEVYHRRGGPGYHVGRRRMLLGATLFVLGTVMAVVGLVIASTEILSTVGIGRFESRRLAGVLGGLGVPAVFVGILTVLPGSTRLRGVAGLGAGIAVVGVVLFWFVYPDQWLGARVDRHYTFETATIYFLGALLTFWCLFVGIANFKTRNDPGGTVDFEVRKAGRTRVVEVEPDRGQQRGGFSILGGVPRDEGVTVSDGGAATVRQRGDDDEGVDVLSEHPDRPDAVDRYCGNCDHFEYTRHGEGMQPYCAFHEESMDDMAPCDDWTAQGED